MDANKGISGKKPSYVELKERRGNEKILEEIIKANKKTLDYLAER